MLSAWGIFWDVEESEQLCSKVQWADDGNPLLKWGLKKFSGMLLGSSERAAPYIAKTRALPRATIISMTEPLKYLVQIMLMSEAISFHIFFC